MKKTWYYAEGSKKAELWTIAHPYFTAMCLSFVVIGFGINKPIKYSILSLILLCYFLGLQAAHCFDQLPSVKGSKYIRYLTAKELIIIGSICLVVALGIGVWFVNFYKAIHFLWLVPLQTFFVVAYPTGKPLKFFHSDASFSFSFGSLPLIISFYTNNLYFSWIVIPFAMVCATISRIEILLSRYSRKLRAENADEKYLQKPEAALKTLCALSYLLAAAILLW